MNYLIFDIETVATPLPPEVIEQIQEENAVNEDEILAKLTAKYKRQETIDSHFVTDLQKARDKEAGAVEKYSKELSFNPFYSEIICIGVCLYDSFEAIEEYKCFFGAPELNILQMFLNYSPPDRYVTYNGVRFDWVHIRNKIVKYNLELLNGKLSYKNHIDLTQAGIQKYQKATKLDDACKFNYISQDQAKELYPVKDFEDQNLTGEDVARLHQLDKMDEGNRVSNYCLQDVWKTTKLLQAYLRTEEL